MKISSFSSSCSSSASSTTTTFNGNLCNSQNGTAGCLSGILRRLLCTGNLRTHPFDCVKEANRVESDHQKDLKMEEKIEVVGAPGIVARLMGLDSLPESNLVTTGRTPESIGRSRSVNSVDYWSEFDPTQGQHRRVRSSSSFREMPTFLQKENDEFLLLSFENVGETKELESKGRKSDMGCGELKQRRKDGSKNKERRREQRIPQEKKEDQERNKRGCKKDDFLVFSFENVVESNELESKGRKSVKSSPELKQRTKDYKENRRQKRVSHMKKEDQERNKRDCNKNDNQKKRISNRPSRKISDPCENKHLGSISAHNKEDIRKMCAPSKPMSTLKPTKHKEVSNGAKLAKKKKSESTLKEVQQDCSSENSSPVSVLDLAEFLMETEIHLSEEDSRLKDSNSRRKLCPDLANSNCPSSHATDVSASGLKAIDDNAIESTKTDTQSQDYLEMWGEVCKLGEEDIKTSNWIQSEMWKMEDLEEIGIGFGLQIIDHLLDEFLAELSTL